MSYAVDVAAVAACVPIATVLRLGMDVPERFIPLMTVGPIVMATLSLPILWFSGGHRRIWRYLSVADIILSGRTALFCVLAFTAGMFLIDRLESMPRSLPFLLWPILLILLVAPRLAYRWWIQGFSSLSNDQSGVERAILVGRIDDLGVALSALGQGTRLGLKPIALLSESRDEIGRILHGVPIMGRYTGLRRVARRLVERGPAATRLVIVSDPRILGPQTMGRLVDQAGSLGMTVLRLSQLSALGSASPRDAVSLQPVDVTDLLSRAVVEPKIEPVAELIEGRVVLVTGAGGTIGSELSRQIAERKPARLILADLSEFNLYEIDREIAGAETDLDRRSVLVDVADRTAVERLFATERPELVFHAAALKHVPMVEGNPVSGARSNVLGTRTVVDACRRFGVTAMVQISTDKAVRPTNVMGATKRFAEFYCQTADMASSSASAAGNTRFVTVRFGNVLGSSGSVIPLFAEQIRKGGPVTVTHPDIQRYFMTVGEAVGLVLQAASHGNTARGERGRIYILDMGQPVRVADVARRMILLSGLQPDHDVAIRFVGLRPGEKMVEELFDETEPTLPSGIPGLLSGHPTPPPPDALAAATDKLAAAVAGWDDAAVLDVLADIVPGFEHATGDTTSGRPASDRSGHLSVVGGRDVPSG